MSKSTLSRELLRIGKAWPPDILRPRLQYGNYLVAFAESKELQKKLSPKTVRSQQRLLDNTLKEKYALSEKMLYPASYPDKYEKLVDLLEEAVETNEAQAAGKTSVWSRVFK